MGAAGGPLSQKGTLVRVDKRIKGYVSVLTAATLWAISGTVGKALFISGMSPSDLVQVRVTFSWALLAVVFAFFFRPLCRIHLKDLGLFALLGGVAMALVQTTYFYAISKIPVAAAIFLQYLSPVIVALLSISLWNERLTQGKILALCLSVLGCYLVAGGYSLSLLEMNREGILYSLASALCFACYTLLGERMMHRYSPWTVLFYSLLFAAVSWHVFYPPFHYLWAGHSVKSWAGMLYVAFMGTLLPFGLFFVGVNYLRSTRATIASTLEPISAGLFAYLFLGESLGPLQMVGGAMVAGSIVLLEWQREKDVESPEVIRSLLHRSPCDPLGHKNP